MYGFNRKMKQNFDILYRKKAFFGMHIRLNLKSIVCWYFNQTIQPGIGDKNWWHNRILSRNRGIVIFSRIYERAWLAVLHPTWKGRCRGLITPPNSILNRFAARRTARWTCAVGRNAPIRVRKQLMLSKPATFQVILSHFFLAFL